ncbi:hypothetical protein AMAG_14835 [Allomyces macrogynus ATCC 38327]|uniref:RRM domain-containing protein n=1 Tax=Allomyces macrogynus (strain ATCC 38327) TaxID=578462 RepID=A0A0L0T5N8_ALLM3|nr:hypothetical protein AMAG_14835 [Allomyces macrogynus ATCC 38327]|eukprot:KNE69996.1 hypothetical protein AMAG_14835 [Allomyces macrogynus ATCC 38327]
MSTPPGLPTIPGTPSSSDPPSTDPHLSPPPGLLTTPPKTPARPVGATTRALAHSAPTTPNDHALRRARGAAPTADDWTPVLAVAAAAEHAPVSPARSTKSAYDAIGVEDEALESLRDDFVSFPAADTPAAAPPATTVTRESSTNVYIKGLRGLTATSDTVLHSTLEARYGPVLSAKAMLDLATGRGKGFGFVLFAHPRDAATALARIPHDFPGWTAAPAHVSPKVALRALHDPNSTNVYFSNLPVEWNEEDVVKLVRPWVVSSARVIRHADGRSKGVGFARMVDREAARKVIETWNKRAVPGGSGGVPLQVRFADSERQKEMKRAMGQGGKDTMVGTATGTRASATAGPTTPAGLRPATTTTTAQHQVRRDSRGHHHHHHAHARGPAPLSAPTHSHGPPHAPIAALAPLAPASASVPSAPQPSPTDAPTTPISPTHPHPHAHAHAAYLYGAIPLWPMYQHPPPPHGVYGAHVPPPPPGLPEGVPQPYAVPYPYAAAAPASGGGEYWRLYAWPTGSADPQGGVVVQGPPGAPGGSGPGQGGG